MPNFLQYNIGGRGVSEDPKKWLCNLGTTLKILLWARSSSFPIWSQLWFEILFEWTQNYYNCYKSVSNIPHLQTCRYFQPDFFKSPFCAFRKLVCSENFHVCRVQGLFLPFAAFSQSPRVPSCYQSPSGLQPHPQSWEKHWFSGWYKVEFGIIFLLCGRFQLQGGGVLVAAF